MEPEHFAYQLITDFGFKELPIDPFFIAKELDITVEETELKGASGILFRSGSNRVIGLNRNLKPFTKKKFTVAHELGHNEIPTHKGANFECIEESFHSFFSIPQVEREANKFAAELLLPKFLFRPLCFKYRPTFEDINELAEFCDTSLSVTAIKYMDFTDECCALIASDAKKVKWIAKSQSFPFIQIGSPIASGTLTKSYLVKGMESGFAEQETYASLWVEGENIRRDTKIIESCLPLPEYKTILTLLWFFDVIAEDDDDYEERYEEKEWKWSQ